MLNRFFPRALADRLFFILLALCLCAAASADPAQCMDDPREHVREIGRAIDAADVNSFTELVDMDALLNNAMDVFVKEASRPENAKRLPPMLALLLPGLTASGSSPVKDLLLGEAKNFVMAGIASGAFAGRKPDPAKAQGMLAPLFNQASMGRKEIRNIGKPVKNGNGWLVPFVIYDYGSENEYPIKALLERRGEDLKLTGLENMRLLIYQIGEESAGALE